MKSLIFRATVHRLICCGVVGSVSLLAATGLGAASAPALIDDFSDPLRTSVGATRLLIDDRGAGSQSTARQTCANGKLRVQGQLTPGRGVPGFISVPLLLNAEAAPVDASAYAGVRLKVRVISGNLAVQVASTPIDNFDFHTSPPLTRHSELREIRISFKDLKRGWSPQTSLDLTSVTSVNLVSFALASEAFAYEVAEVGFYN